MQVVFSALVFLVHASAGLCSQGSHHEINWWGLGSQYSDSPAVGWLSLTFLAFAFGLCHVIKKPLSLYLETRSKDIRRQIEEGIRIKKESEEKLRVYEDKLKSLGQEIDKMKAAFSEQAQAEQKERERQINEMKERIQREADDTIKADWEKSKNRLAEEVVKKAVAMAEQTIVNSKREQMDRFLKDALIEDLEVATKEVH